MMQLDNVLFKGINQEDCLRMVTCFNADCRRYKAGAFIAEFGEFTDRLGIILSGNVVIVRYDINGVRTIIESVEKGGVFGTFFTYNILRRNSVEIIAEKDCEVMFVHRSEITKRCEQACQCHSQVVENLLKIMSENIVRLNQRIDVLSQRSIEERLISYLEIVEDKTPEGKTPQIPFSTTALSDYLCVNRSALQRQISKMKEAGTLTISKRKFRLNINRDDHNVS